MINFFHSFWEAPMISKICPRLTDKIITNIYTSALSASYIKKFGCNINLHTTTLGTKLLEGIPYNDVKLSLNEIPEDVDYRFWACGKFYALKNEELGNVHIDNDVFIKTERCLYELLYNDCDAIVQSYDDIYFTNKEINYKILKFLEKSSVYPFANVDKMSSKSYNCGIIGLKNEELKRKYIELYLCAIKMFKDTKFLYFLTSPDLICEQKLLYEISNGYRIKMLLTDKTIYSKEMQKRAIDIGYQHMVAQSKYVHSNKTIDALKRIDFDTYNKVTTNIELLKKDF